MTACNKFMWLNQIWEVIGWLRHFFNNNDICYTFIGYGAQIMFQTKGENFILL